MNNLSTKSNFNAGFQKKRLFGWSVEEINFLKHGVKKFGDSNWDKILGSYDFHFSRNVNSLRKKWKRLESQQPNLLNQADSQTKINIRSWSEEEFRKLEEGVKMYGTNWKLIIKKLNFTGRSVNALSKKWRYEKKKMNEMGIGSNQNELKESNQHELLRDKKQDKKKKKKIKKKKKKSNVSPNKERKIFDPLSLEISNKKMETRIIEERSYKINPFPFEEGNLCLDNSFEEFEMNRTDNLHTILNDPDMSLLLESNLSPKNHRKIPRFSPKLKYFNDSFNTSDDFTFF